jgi:glycerol kinase
LDGLCQRLADLLRLPVQRPENVEATARGLACLLARRPASWDNHASGEMFTPREHHALSQRHARFRAELRLAVHHVNVAKHPV